MSSTQIKLTFNPAGFAECLAGMSDLVEATAVRLAEQARAELNGPGSYTVEMTTKPRFHDSEYGVSRPVAYARVVADAAASADEAENKSMSKAVY